MRLSGFQEIAQHRWLQHKKLDEVRINFEYLDTYVYRAVNQTVVLHKAFCDGVFIGQVKSYPQEHRPLVFCPKYRNSRSTTLSAEVEAYDMEEMRKAIRWWMAVCEFPFDYSQEKKSS